MKTLFALFLLIITVFACKQVNPEQDFEDNFPERVNLLALKESAFSATLEDTLDSTKNTVYCSTLLFAWEGIKSELRDIHINDQLKELKMLHSSKSHKKSLRSEEYASTVKIEGLDIKAIVKFAKSLPFKNQFEAFDNGLNWQGTRVNAFGAKGDFKNVIDQIEILYYESDSNFVIKLLPKDHDHEIILYKTPKHFRTMIDILNKVTENIELGVLERKQEKYRWKYIFADEDELLVPNIGFNIEYNYSDLVSSKLSNMNQEYKIIKAYQRTAFLLNNEGAKIQSEAEISLEATSMGPVNVISPKTMHFNQPFFVMMKRKDAKYPYFGVWIETTELMEH